MIYYVYTMKKVCEIKVLCNSIRNFYITFPDYAKSVVSLSVEGVSSVCLNTT